MPVPDVQSIMRPWLELTADGQEHTLQSAIQALGDHFQLTPEERSEMLPSGFQPKFTNRVAWAATHLNKAGALARVGRGRYRITERGRKLLSEDGQVAPKLAQFPEYQEFKGRAKQVDAPSTPLEDVAPAELIEAAIQSVRAAVGTELLDRIKAAPPDFFERLVVELLTTMATAGVAATRAKPLGGLATAASTV